MSRDRHDTPVLNYRAAEAAPRDDELSARERLLLRLVNHRVVMAPTLAGVLDALFDDAAPVLPCDRMGLAFVDDDGTTLTAAHVVAGYRPLRLREGYRAPLAGSSLEQVIRQAPQYSRFLMGMAQLGAEISSPLGFRRRLKGHVDLKEKALLPVQNLARYYACAEGLTGSSTLDRLAAVRDAGGRGSEQAETLGRAYEAMTGLFTRHQAEASRAGLPRCGPVDTGRLSAEDRESLQSALRTVACIQERLPRRAAF